MRDWLFSYNGREFAPRKNIVIGVDSFLYMLLKAENAENPENIKDLTPFIRVIADRICFNLYIQ